MIYRVTATLTLVFDTDEHDFVQSVADARSEMVAYIREIAGVSDYDINVEAEV